jgi:transposase
MRCLKRRLFDLVYKTMLDELVAAQKTGPGGQPGDDSVSSATGSQPTCWLLGQVTSRTRQRQA